MGSQAYLEKIQEFAKRSNLLHIEPSGDGSFLRLTYDINLKEGMTAENKTVAIEVPGDDHNYADQEELMDIINDWMMKLVSPD